MPTLPLTINEHGVPTGGITRNHQQLQLQQRPATPLSQIPGWGGTSGRIFEVKYNDRVRTEYNRPSGMLDLSFDVSFETSDLRPVSPSSYYFAICAEAQAIVRRSEVREENQIIQPSGQYSRLFIYQAGMLPSHSL